MQSISVVEALELDVSETKYPDFLHEVGGGGRPVLCMSSLHTLHYNMNIPSRLSGGDGYLKSFHLSQQISEFYYTEASSSYKTDSIKESSS